MLHMNKNREFDLRTLETNLRKGLISEKDYKSFLKNLPDEKENTEFIEIEEEEEILNNEETQPEGFLTFS